MPKKTNKRAKRKGKTQRQLALSYENDELANNLAKVKGEKPIPHTLKRARDARASEAGRQAKKQRKEDQLALTKKEATKHTLDEDGLAAEAASKSSDKSVREKVGAEFARKKSSLKASKKAEVEEKVDEEDEGSDDSSLGVGEEELYGDDSDEVERALKTLQSASSEDDDDGDLDEDADQSDGDGNEEDEDEDDEDQMAESDENDGESDENDGESDEFSLPNEDLSRESYDSDVDSEALEKEILANEKQRLQRLGDSDEDSADAMDVDSQEDDENGEEGEEILPKKQEKKRSAASKVEQFQFSGVTEDPEVKHNRAKRFEGTFNKSQKASVEKPKEDGPITGTSQAMEKDYLRLTSEPDPSSVRPLEVLRKSLSHVQRKWRQEKNLQYVHSQLKSIRQDLTVQDIKGVFSFLVYETHARICLEANDLLEFGSCLSVLLTAYENSTKDELIGAHPSEFFGYAILRALLEDTPKVVVELLKKIGADMVQSDSVQHALSVAKAVQAGDYHKFFRLIDTAPDMGAYLIDHMVDAMRKRSMTTMLKAMKKQVPLDYATRELGFSSVDECTRFFKKSGVSIKGGNIIAKD